ncbi:MAG: hypothetical protein KAS67_07115 [Thermoplasmata archaeon]|nr:hypothetical protein [Thermoplasmata archaeon]
MNIKVYIKRINVEITSHPGRVHNGQAITSARMMWAERHITSSTTTPIDSKKTIEIVREFATKHGLGIKVYDVSKSSVAFRAWINGIRTTPTVLIGKQKIEGIPTLEELENALAMMKK